MYIFMYINMYIIYASTILAHVFQSSGYTALKNKRIMFIENIVLLGVKLNDKTHCRIGTTVQFQSQFMVMCESCNI
jgi:hypothetical protein